MVRWWSFGDGGRFIQHECVVSGWETWSLGESERACGVDVQLYQEKKVRARFLCLVSRSSMSLCATVACSQNQRTLWLCQATTLLHLSNDSLAYPPSHMSVARMPLFEKPSTFSSSGVRLCAKSCKRTTHLLEPLPLFGLLDMRALLFASAASRPQVALRAISALPNLPVGFPQLLVDSVSRHRSLRPAPSVTKVLQQTCS